MADTHETTADIIAEMRFHGQQNIDAEKGKPEYGILTMEGRITQNYADRFEAAYKREREAITPKSDPDWKDICAKCKDGDIEPNYCEYYGEPNGCNSPIYGEHPTAKKSLVVGDCAKLREALKATLDLFWDIHNANRSPQSNRAYAVIRQINAALAAPVKNCEVGTAEEQCRRFRKYCGCRCLTKCKVYEKGIALGIVNDNNYYKTDCRFVWAQMPYEEGGSK